MSISSNNDRLTVIIPKSLKEDLKVLADNSNRSVSNYVVTILENHIADSKRGMQRDTKRVVNQRSEDKFYVDIDLD